MCCCCAGPFLIPGCSVEMTATSCLTRPLKQIAAQHLRFRIRSRVCKDTMPPASPALSMSPAWRPQFLWTVPQLQPPVSAACRRRLGMTCVAKTRLLCCAFASKQCSEGGAWRHSVCSWPDDVPDDLQSSGQDEPERQPWALASRCCCCCCCCCCCWLCCAMEGWALRTRPGCALLAPCVSAGVQDRC